MLEQSPGEAACPNVGLLIESYAQQDILHVNGFDISFLHTINSHADTSKSIRFPSQSLADTDAPKLKSISTWLPPTTTWGRKERQIGLPSYSSDDTDSALLFPHQIFQSIQQTPSNVYLHR